MHMHVICQRERKEERDRKREREIDLSMWLKLEAIYVPEQRSRIMNKRSTGNDGKAVQYMVYNHFPICNPLFSH